MIPPPRQCLLALVCCAILAQGSACRRKHPDEKRKDKGGEKEQATVRKTPPARTNASQTPGATSQQIEALTGAHTRIVWNECLIPGGSDPFSDGDQQRLCGLDTRDGRGERILREEVGNYSRPILSADGETILYTRRREERKDGKKDVSLTILSTDWKGREPTPLAQGYIADAWRDPATGVEWIYCTRKFRGFRGNNFQARQLWRFQLNNPKREELVFEESRLAPSDNIQLSRDGHRACALFPWPNGGILKLDASPPSVLKLRNGCWPSMAPDASGASWVFDGDHRSAHFFADDGERAWDVKFDAPCAKLGETYHPRWTNHPRFMVLTGPYVAGKKRETAIEAKRNQPDVFLGRFTEQADRVEAWLQVSNPGFAKAYPDAWIAGGEGASLKLAPAVARAPASAALTWPSNPQGLLFLWLDRKSLNQWKSRDGRSHAADLTGSGAARTGRSGGMIFDGGEFQVEREDAEPIHQHLAAGADAAFETVVSLDPNAEASGWVLRSAGFSLRIEKRTLTAMRDDGAFQQAALAPSANPLHVTVNRRGTQFEIYLNGKITPAQSGTSAPPAPANSIAFGTGSRGMELQGIAIFDRALAADEIEKNAGAQLGRLRSLPAAPPQIRVIGTLVEASQVPAPESIEPYTGALVCCTYKVEKSVSGDFKGDRILVKHWGLLNRQPVSGFPRELGRSYELTLERASDHPELQGERVADDTEAFDLEPWIDVSTPIVR
jgi:hypothetical protein